MFAKRLSQLIPVCRCKGEPLTGAIDQPCAYHRNAIEMFKQLRALMVLDVSLKNPARAVFEGFIPPEEAEAKFAACMAQIQRLMLAIVMRAEKDEKAIIEVPSGG